MLFWYRGYQIFLLWPKPPSKIHKSAN